jgi:ankyrin repeat protein
VKSTFLPNSRVALFVSLGQAARLNSTGIYSHCSSSALCEAMRLLQCCDTGTVVLTQFDDECIPPYAILSHTWGLDADEVTFEDLTNGTGKNKPGYKKIRYCAEQAKLDDLQYFWIDTCCIDKRSSTELSEAINSMYRWYQNANVCYAYLADVPSKIEFSSSRWFARGWTLQELLAPSELIFFDEEWKRLGTRASLQQSVSSCTGIPEGILAGSDDPERISIAQRMSWAAKRETKRLEDRAYCLIGIFGINMPLLYGEGERAFLRLQEEIMKISDDHSLFAWRSSDKRGGLLATSAASFIGSHNIVQSNPFDALNSPFTMSSRGIYLDVRFMGKGRQGLGLAILHCKERGGEGTLIAIYVRDLFLTMEKFSRVWSEKFETFDRRKFRLSQYPMRRICIQTGRLISKNPRNGDNIAPELYPDDVLKDLMSFGEPTSLLRAAKRGLEEVVWLLLTRSDIEANFEDEDGRTALTHAVIGGHRTVVGILLARSDVKTDLKDKDGLTPLWWAAWVKNEAIVEVLLKSGRIHADSHNNYSRTLLSWAAEEGHTAIVNMLLNESADLESKDENGRTPLSWAAEKGSEAVVNMLLNKGADLESKDKNGQTPLLWASQYRNKAVVDILLDKGVNLPSQEEDHYQERLLVAIWYGHEAILKMLLKRDEANINFKDKSGRTPLSWAAEKGSEAVVDILLHEGADLESKDKNGQTPLLWAAQYGNKAVVNLLLDKGIDLLSKDKGINLLSKDKDYYQEQMLVAIWYGHEAMVKLLLDSKADVNFKDSRGRTPLLWAAQEGHLAVVERLLQEKVDVNAALQAAAERGHLAVVERLLQAKANVNVAAAASSGRTALQAAAEGGHLAVVERLLQAKANVNAAAANYNGRTALQAAAEGGHLAVVERLLQAKANVNAAAVNYSGRTALQAAAEGGHLAVVERLLQAKANVNAAAANYGGRTALQAAAEGGHLAVVECLRRNSTVGFGFRLF